MKGKLHFKQILCQFLNYSLIGVQTNILGYGIFLVLTYASNSPKLIMTLLYFVSALISFVANYRFTFRCKGRIGVAGIRYIIVQFLGYLLNLCLLMLFVDWFDFSYHIVQAIAIIVVAFFLFILLRVFVFKGHLPKGDGLKL